MKSFWHDRRGRLMTLTNYWWLLIWLFTAGLLLTLVIPKRQEIINGQKELRWYPFAAIAIIVPYIIWTGFRGDSFGDTSAYRQAFMEIPELSGIADYITSDTKDKGFWFFMSAFKTIFGDSDVIFFLVLGAVQLVIIALIFRKYSCNYWLSIFIFIASTDYISWTFNCVRQFLAVTMVLACFNLLVKRKYIPLIIVILVASTIHASALIFLPFIFVVQGKPWSKKLLLFSIPVLLVILFLDRYTNVITDVMENTQYANAVGQFLNDDGVNIYRVLFYSVPTFLSLIFRRRLAAQNNEAMNVCVNLSIISTEFYIIGFFTSGIIAGRIPIWFSIMPMCILLPWIIQTVFNKRSAILLNIALIGVFCLFFVYQMFYTWGL